MPCGATWRTYIPLGFESLQITKRCLNALIREVALVLSKQAITCLCVLRLFDAVPQVGFLQGIESDDYAVYLCERFIQVSFYRGIGELDFLTQA